MINNRTYNFFRTKIVLLVFICSLTNVLYCKSTDSLEGSSFRAIKTNVVKLGRERITRIVGVIEVPENRTKPNSNLIEIPVVIFKSISSQPEAPVFRLAGGPGESNIVKEITNIDLLKNHDFVFVGYRGVDGTSILKSKKLTNALKGINNQILSDSSLNNIEQIAFDYLKSLQNEGTDINGYTIMEVIEDIELVRSAMGYEKINLLSGSYGTRVALIYSYKYPRRINRTIMNGANPPGHFLWYPDKTEEIINKWDAIYQSAGRGSVKKAMDVAFDEMPEKWLFFKLDKDKIKMATFVFLFSTDMAVMAFDAYFRADQYGDYSGLYALQKAYDIFVPRNTWGDMFQKGFSADFDPTINYREYLRSYEENTLLGANYALLLWGSSGTWQSQSIPEEYKQLRLSNTETLILSGELDVSTPVDFTVEKLIPSLTNAHHIILTNMSHTDVASKQPENYKKTINEFFLTGTVSNYFETTEINFKPKYRLNFLVKIGFPMLLFF